jgi:hypothetical protein
LTGTKWPHSGPAFERAGGLAALGIAQIRRDDAVPALELVERVERMGRQARDRRIEAAAGDDQQRKAGTGLFVMDANVAFFMEFGASEATSIEVCNGCDGVSSGRTDGPSRDLRILLHGLLHRRRLRRETAAASP